MATADSTVKAVLNHLLQNGGGYFHCSSGVEKRGRKTVVQSLV